MDITLDLQRDGKRRSRASSAASIRGEARYLLQQQQELDLHSYGDFQPHSNSRRRRRRGQRRRWPFEEHGDEDGNDDDDDDDDGHRHALDHDNDDEVCLHDPLNPSVWHCLPSELLERILACLPMASLFKFRAVCRAWNTVPFQPVFKSLRALSMTPEAWLIMLAAPPQESDPLSNWSFAFTLEDNKAVPLPLSFLPFPPDPGCFSYCSSAGGLFCYHYHMGFAGEFESNSIWVGNPFTRDWKCLPPMIGSFPLNFPIRGLAGMAVLDSAHGETQPNRPVHYKIIVRTGSQRTWGSAMMTEEYDSRTNEWRVTTMENVPLDHRIEQVVYCKGTLYFLTWQARNGIYAYHLEKEEWTRILPPKRYQFTSPHMVECCGQLVLVAGIGRHHTTRCRGIRRHHIRTIGIKLWQLVEDSSAGASSSPPLAATDAEPFFGGMHASSWTWLSSMPEDLVQEFVTGVHFHCTSIHNLIYLTNSTNMLIFDALTRLWRRVIVSQLPFSVQDFVSFVPKLEVCP